MTTATDNTAIVHTVNARRPVSAEDRLPVRGPAASTSSIVDCGDWQASNAPGGFAAFLARIADAGVDASDVTETIKIGMGDAATSLEDLF